MPNWRFHLSVGAVLTVFLIYTCYYLGYWYLFVDSGKIQYLFWVHIIFVTLLGSLLPDFDERRTKIRRTLGWILGGFIIISIIIINYQNISINDLPGFLVIGLVFLILLIILGVVIPFRHHGLLHSVFAAFVFSISWFLIEYFIFDMLMLQAITIGTFAFCGFMLHLVLDKDLKWI